MSVELRPTDTTKSYEYFLNLSIGSIVIMLFGRKEGRFFLIFQNQKKKIFFPTPLYTENYKR